MRLKIISVLCVLMFTLIGVRAENTKTIEEYLKEVYQVGIFDNGKGHFEYTTSWANWEPIGLIPKVACEHKWVLSGIIRAYSEVSCSVFHSDGVCGYSFPTQKRICKLCGREEEAKEITESTWIPALRTEYEIIKSSFSKVIIIDGK